MNDGFEPRDEDHRLLTGAGRFLDDERAAGAALGRFVRSPHAFAAIRGDRYGGGAGHAGRAGGADRRRSASGAGVGNVSIATSRCRTAPAWCVPHRPALAGDVARHVGDPVALVVAETEAAARDAAELVAVDYERARAGDRPRPRRRRRARRSSGPRRRAISRSTGTASRADPTAAPALDEASSPARRMSRGCASSTSASSWRRWSRAARSPRYDARDRPLRPALSPRRAPS